MCVCVCVCVRLSERASALAKDNEAEDYVEHEMCKRLQKRSFVKKRCNNSWRCAATVKPL